VAGQAAESAAPRDKQVVPARTIQLKEDKDVAWKALWDQGRELARNGRLVEAAPVYEALLGMREGLEAARWELVTILLQLKREESAFPHLELLVEAAPRNLQYLFALAEVSRGRNNAARAGELYKKVLQREPGNLQALRGAASAFLAQQKKGEAAAMLETLLQREPARLALREELGNLYYEMGAYDKAGAHFTVLARENQADPAILLKTAQVYDKSGLESQAVEYWQRLAHTSKSAEAKERLTAYYLKGGKGEDALVHLLPLVEKEPSSPRLLKRLGQIYVSLSRLPEALAYFERYISRKPEDKEVLRQVIDIHAVLGNTPGGWSWGAASALSLGPTSKTWSAEPDSMRRAASCGRRSPCMTKSWRSPPMILRSWPNGPRSCLRAAMKTRPAPCGAIWRGGKNFSKCLRFFSEWSRETQRFLKNWQACTLTGENWQKAWRSFPGWKPLG